MSVQKYHWYEKRLWQITLAYSALIVIGLVVIIFWSTEELLKIGGITSVVTGILGIVQYWLVTRHEIRGIAEEVKKPVNELINNTRILSSASALGIKTILKSSLDTDTDKEMCEAMESLYREAGPTIRIASVNTPTFFNHGRAPNAQLKRLLENVDDFHLEVVLTDPRSPIIIERSKMDAAIYKESPEPFGRIELSIKYFMGLQSLFPGKVRLSLTPIHPLARIVITKSLCFYHPLHLGYREGVVDIDDKGRGVSALHAMLVFNNSSPNYALAENHFQWLQGHSQDITSREDVSRILREAKPLYKT